MKILKTKEHKESVRKLYMKHKKQLAKEVNKCEQKLTPKNGWMRWITDLVFSVDQWLRNHKK